MKLELDLAAAPPPELLPVLAVLTKITGASAPDGALRIFLQLTRLQLRELVAAAQSQPVFFWANQPVAPIPWDRDALIGVSENLREPATAPAPTAASTTPPRRARPVGTPLAVDGGEHFLALTLPSPEHPSYAGALDLVRSRGFVLEPSNRKWWLRDRHKVLNLLAEQGARLREEFGAQFTANFEKNTAHLNPVGILCAAGSKGADFDVTIALRAGAADEAQIRSALAGSRGYLEIEDKIFLFDPALVRRISEAPAGAGRRSRRGRGPPAHPARDRRPRGRARRDAGRALARLPAPRGVEAAERRSSPALRPHPGTHPG